MNNFTNQDLLVKLEQMINKSSKELREEIKSINNNMNQKLGNLEETLQEIEDKIAFIDRANRQNNIAIFRSKTHQQNFLRATLSPLNHIWLLYFKQLMPRRPKIKYNLSKALKRSANKKKQKVCIKNLKLYLNRIPYTIEELENPTNVDTCMKQEPAIHPKNISVPIAIIWQFYSEEVFTDNKSTVNEGTKERKRPYQSYPQTTLKNTQINMKPRNTNININPSIKNPYGIRNHIHD